VDAVREGDTGEVPSSTAHFCPRGSVVRIPGLRPQAGRHQSRGDAVLRPTYSYTSTSLRQPEYSVTSAAPWGDSAAACVIILERFVRAASTLRANLSSMMPLENGHVRMGDEDT